MEGKVIGTSAFSIDDAKKAGLAGDNWRKYPRNMLFARAMSNGVKWYCPNVFGGPVYSPDELGATIDADEGSVIAVSQTPTKVVDAEVAISSDQVQELEQLIIRKGADVAKLASYYKVAAIDDLTIEQHAKAVSLLRSRADVSQEPHIVVPAIDEIENGVK